MMVERSFRRRDPERTRLKILRAATREFAAHGLAGARVDRIAALAETNKRMLYHYFDSKAGRYQSALELCYSKFRLAYSRLKLKELNPIQAIGKVVSFVWDYYLRHPELISLVNVENVHKARYLRKAKSLQTQNQQFVCDMQDLLDRGTQAGLFRPQIDAVQVHITIASVAYHYLTNRYTGSIVFNRKLSGMRALDERLKFNIETILRLLCTSETLDRIVNGEIVYG